MNKRDRKYWLHRITGGEYARPVASPLLENWRYLSIGWSCWSSDDFAKEVQEKGLDAINKKEPLYRNRYSLKRFIHDMHAGDYVVVPTYGEFGIYEIVDDIILSNESIPMTYMVDWNNNKVTREGNELYDIDGNEVDLGFYRKVRPVVERLSRAEDAQEGLYRRMKIQQTNADISDLWAEIETIIKGKEVKSKPSREYNIELLQDVVNFCATLQKYAEIENLSREDAISFANQIVNLFGVDNSESTVLQRIGLNDMRFIDTSISGSSGFRFADGISNCSIDQTISFGLLKKDVDVQKVTLLPLSADKTLIKQSKSIDFAKWYFTDTILFQDGISYTRSDIIGYYIILSPKDDKRNDIRLFNVRRSGISINGNELPCISDPVEASFRQIIYEIIESFRIEGILNITTTEELSQHIERSQALFIKSLIIKNYKLFSEGKEIEFRDRFTVIIGNNATGKTSILSALRLLLDSMLPNRLNETSGYTYYGYYGSIWQEHVNREILYSGGLKYHFPVTIDAVFNDFGKVSRVRNEESRKTQNKNKKLDDYFKQVNNDETGNLRLPLISYCGVERTRPIETTKARNKLHGNRYDGYNSCLETHCSTTYLRMWLNALQKNAKQNTRTKEILKCFIDAVCSCFSEERIVNIEYVYWETQTAKNKKDKVDDIVLTQEDAEGNQKRLLLRSMSAGYRTMIGLIADLAFRCICLNPQLGKDAIIGTKGIVLIDEIDMHLHPSWQRHVVADLMRCFPKLQFIVTTHSPFVVQSLKKEQIINLAGEDAINDPLNESLATNAYYMGVDSDRSILFQRLEEEAYDILKAIRSGDRSEKEIDTMLKRFSLLNGTDPVYVAKLRLENSLAKSERLYKSLE